MPHASPSGTLRKPRLGILLSGGGRTLQNLIERIASGRLRADIAIVIADRSQALGLQRAAAANLPHACIPAASDAIDLLRASGADLVCLCGYLRLLPIPTDLKGRVLNIHPSLLPRHGGKGMHGHHVHAAVLAAGDRESGCTVHICSEEYDRGPIVAQQRVPVLPGDTEESLAARVFAAECEAYPAAIEQYWKSLN